MSHVGGVGVAVMDGDRETFVLHHRPRDIAEGIGEFAGRPRQDIDGARGDGVLVVRAVGREQLEAVAARVPQAVDVHPVAYVAQVATADDPDGALRGERAQRVGAALDEGRGVGLVDDLRQRAVEVEEHRGPTAGHQLLELAVDLLGVGDGRHGGAAGAHRDPGQIGHHGVGAAGQHLLGVPVEFEPDDEAEAPALAGGDIGRVAAEDGAPNGPGAQALRGVDQGGRIEVPGALDHQADQVFEPGRPQGLGAVAAGRVDGGGDAGLPQAPQQVNGGGLGRGDHAAQVEDHRVVVAPVDGRGSCGHPCDDATARGLGVRLPRGWGLKPHVRLWGEVLVFLP